MLNTKKWRLMEDDLPFSVGWFLGSNAVNFQGCSSLCSFDPLKSRFILLMAEKSCTTLNVSSPVNNGILYDFPYQLVSRISSINSSVLNSQNISLLRKFNPDRTNKLEIMITDWWWQVCIGKKNLSYISYWLVNKDPENWLIVISIFNIPGLSIICCGTQTAGICSLLHGFLNCLTHDDMQLMNVNDDTELEKLDISL